MPIAASDLKCWAAASRPTADAQTTGGVIQDAAHASGGYRVEFTDLAANDDVEALSDGADTRTVTVTGRNAAGAIVTDSITLNGTTPAQAGTPNTFERILRVELSAKDASRTVTVRRAPTGATIATVAPNELGTTRMFYDAQAPASGTTKRYELIYLKNQHGTLTLTNAKVVLSADPASKIKIAVRGSKGDAGTIADRVQGSVPEGLTVSDDSVEVAVPTGTLAAGERIGVWVEQSIASADSPFKNTFDVQLKGNTT